MCVCVCVCVAKLKLDTRVCVYLLCSQGFISTCCVLRGSLCTCCVFRGSCVLNCCVLRGLSVLVVFSGVCLTLVAFPVCIVVFSGVHLYLGVRLYLLCSQGFVCTCCVLSGLYVICCVLRGLCVLVFSGFVCIFLCSQGFVCTCLLSGVRVYLLCSQGFVFTCCVLRAIQQVQQVHMNPLTLAHGTETHNNDDDVGLHE